MIARALGWLFRAIGRVRGGDAGRDLERVGAELEDLERAPRQPAATER